MSSVTPEPGRYPAKLLGSDAPRRVSEGHPIKLMTFNGMPLKHNVKVGTQRPTEVGGGGGQFDRIVQGRGESPKKQKNHMLFLVNPRPFLFSVPGGGLEKAPF